MIWGVHRYANVKRSTSRSVDRVEERRSWADRTLDRAVIVDTVGSRDTDEFRPALAVGRPGSSTSCRTGCATSDGSGAIGFVWRWSDANSMTGAVRAAHALGRRYSCTAT